ncbi:LRR repeats and ubiquitin-like domain-containing protein At2g30105 isoform X1 [Capsicum annuum]|uniref:LRR repeats and ubiquitin-like domain-containing protein At2g30105 isoform X1 n=1 Tax=Capsicum annuum TaxID=4072 RepID=UPI001FB16D81|nr:LRR repeats and ubiquitin-like domain-containing protein At2g30105 isoform X1 [Capsicum annuum]XP_047270599.1 LRR repeats and ubiquitin-like domain-containing protein At2g30105 isoform X1 [Capsicum annuum]XP_047270600.1 LRR repeats and ubiquitin-like domain-containing protein At2g30105 isoform X1 [Capsicum annuum]
MEKEGKSDGDGDGGDRSTIIKVNVKFAGRSIPVEISDESTVKHLKSLLQPLTNVLPRGQKLIFKGKVLVDEMTLKSLEVGNGAKIMLMASQGLHQGDGPLRKEASNLSTVRRMPEAMRPKRDVPEVPVVKSQLERWKATGVIALSGCNLKTLPDEVLTCGSSARVLDLSHNSLQHLPSSINSLSSLQKLILNGNEIMDNSLSWEELASLKSLMFISLNQNHIATLPCEIGTLTSLRQLHIAHNYLTDLPSEIGQLTGLEVLKVNNNRIHSIPESIGGCASLIEVDLSSNLLLELPETISKLKDLKALYLRNNGLKSLPSSIFKQCCELSILDLHGTEITMDVICQIEGWENFDERRRSKHQKQLDFRVSSSGKFDEGADKS